MFVSAFLIFPLILQSLSADHLPAYNVENLFRNSSPGIQRTTQCDEQISLITESDQYTLLKMIDASSKIPPSGSLNGNFFDLGDFNECYQLKSSITTRNIQGKYCLGTVAFPGAQSEQKIMRTDFIHPNPTPRVLVGSPIGFHWALCIPSGCTAEDFSTDLISLDEMWCYSEETEPALDTGAWVTIGVLIFFLVLVVLSTIFDVYWYYSEKTEAPRDIFIAFSALTNGRKLITASKSSDQLSCLNGIKAISMMWVVLGHEFGNVTSAPIRNMFDVQNFMKDPANMYMLSATLSVDTFFVVGGLVTVYVFLKAMDKGVKFNIFTFYLHRYLRLTPALFIMALIHMYLLKYLGKGPLWNGVDIMLGTGCRNVWWTTLTYLGNYFLDEGACVAQSWYLMVDMQLFVLSPLILIPLAKWPQWTVMGIGFATLASMAISFAIGYSYELPPFITTFGANSTLFSQKYYVQPWTRFGPYVMGMGLGYFIYVMRKNGKKLHVNRWVVLVLWVCGLAIMAGILWGPYDLCINGAMKEYRLASAFFLGYRRHVWTVGLSIVIFLCVSGHGGPINAFLSHPVFHFLTKLSYSVYLTHYCIIMIRFSTVKASIEFSTFNMMRDFWGDFVLSIAFGLVLCLTFESPIITLEKIIFGGGNKGKTKKTLPT